MSDTESEHINHPKMNDLLFGHERAERDFLDSFNSGRLHHGWLITGPKGIGKATLAWKCAKFLLSDDDNDTSDGLFGDDLAAQATSLDIDPEKAVIQRIKSGGHGGIVVAERSVNTKTGKLRNDIVIDDIRSIISFFSRTSSEGGWRIAIIDAADEMNSNAANALLKVLEEPPEKSILFLIAHSPGKLLPTIRSRCRTLELNPLSNDSVRAMLAHRYPELDMATMNTLTAMCSGAPGRAIEMERLGGATIYQKTFQAISMAPKLNIPDIHKLATEFAAAKADAEYRLFTQIFTAFLERITKAAVLESSEVEILENENQQISRISAMARVDKWLELWEKVGHLLQRADAVNLDRKQVIVSLFSELKATTQG
ncbi:DNA polymerase III subunit delta' [Kordiimonas sp. SCSIO 12610]|uniref:DNA polymerase III subunit delta' n=1 Tax=Kordiimonas sp. SCSIO 12610 TaxID=2829597 RepID=UPI00210A3761|nr:DNA polymerase III subunit delta' [Kordiimonas sp. SCSIO 12610]UTW53938.1 DNA polymerase III subunit delta' [Kordiimonas sp. SCSIO 12610]